MNFNKVEITSDMNKLEESFYSFMNQKEDKRIESDKYVKETTGYNNYDLYRKMRYLINNNLITESVDPDDVDSNIEWNEYDQFNRMSEEEYNQKLQQTKNYNVSLNRIIIAPIHYTNNYGKDVLNDLYNQYNKLNQDNKNLSDYISINIWGYSVKDMYNLMLDYLDNTTNFEPEEYSNIIVRECMVRGDQLGAEILKQNGYSVPNIDNTISNAYLPSSMPYFTSDDFYASYMDMDKIDEAIENNNYYSTVKKLQEGIFGFGKKKEEILPPTIKPKEAIKKAIELFKIAERKFPLLKKLQYKFLEMVPKDHPDYPYYKSFINYNIKNWNPSVSPYTAPILDIGYANKRLIDLPENISDKLINDVYPKFYDFMDDEFTDKYGYEVDLDEDGFTIKIVGIKKKLTNESKLLEMGWNPAVKVTRESMKHAVNRHVNWFNEHRVNIIDLYNNIKLNEGVIESLNESSNVMKRLYAEKDIYPVFIILSYTGTLFGKLERVVRKVHYTHAGLALDYDINQIYTFTRGKIHGKKQNGFGIESLDSYVQSYKYSLVDVLCIFVDGKTYNKIKETVQYFVDNRNRSKYSIVNLLNVLAGRKTVTKQEKVSMICSQFTDFILKTVNINLTKKPSNLVEPNDFEIVSKNPKVYRIFDGYAVRYNKRTAAAYIKLLLKKELRDQILIQNNNFNLEESAIINNMIEPEYTLIFESKLPVKVNSKGDITIKQYKTLEEEYQESHKILEGYGNTNIEGIKQELAKLFYINTILEKKIKYMKSKNETYKKAINLRARILNDFKKYFKIVSKQDSTFDFGSYYENSEYGSYTIDGQTLKNVGKIFVKFLASL